jgi:hypothetical protein
MMSSCGILEKVLDDLCWKGLKGKVKDRVLFLPVIKSLEDVK